ncbi:MAG: glycosyltransferase [Ilumatobacteraceae bacterium]
MRDYRVIYTLFASEAIPIVRWLPSTCRLIVHCAGTDITTSAARPAAYQKALRDVLQTAHHVNCGSEFLVRTALALGAPPEKTSVHYLGVDVPASLASNVCEGAAPTILAVSRLHPVKGLSYTIEAFALVARSTPDVTLEIIGDGPELAPEVEG